MQKISEIKEKLTSMSSIKEACKTKIESNKILKYCLCVSPIILIAYVYVVGVLLRYVTFSFGSVLNPKMAKPYYDLSSIFAYLFSDSRNLMLLLIFTGIVIAAIIVVRKKTKKLFNYDYDEERGIMMSKDGTYGTARWMPPQRMNEKFNVRTVDESITEIYGLDDEGQAVSRIDADSEKMVYGPDYVEKRKDTSPNNHVAVFGGSGSGKTACYANNKVIQTAILGESMVLTDPKGELYENFSKYLEDRGYTVKVFNLVTPSVSDSWNCLRELRKDDLMAQTFADVVIKNTTLNSKSGDSFWSQGEMNILKAMIMYVERNPEMPTNIATAYETLLKSDVRTLDAMFSALPDSNPSKLPYKIFTQSDEKVRAGVLVGLGTRLQVFQNDAVKRMTSTEDIVLEDLGRKKCAYFVIMSDQDSTLNFLASLFFSFLFIDLVRMADKDYGGKLPIPVNFILDEFPNIGQIPDFCKKISTVRSRRINISIIFQTISQLKNRYPDGQWEEILGNCSTHLFLGCNDTETADYISDSIGEMTINVVSKAEDRGKASVILNTKFKENYGYGKRKLLTPEEVRSFPAEKCIVFVQGESPLKLNKCWYFLRSNYAEIASKKVSSTAHVPKWKTKLEAKHNPNTNVVKPKENSPRNIPTPKVEAPNKIVREKVPDEIIEVVEFEEVFEEFSPEDEYLLKAEPGITGEVGEEYNINDYDDAIEEVDDITPIIKSTIKLSAIQGKDSKTAISSL